MTIRPNKENLSRSKKKTPATGLTVAAITPRAFRGMFGVLVLAVSLMLGMGATAVLAQSNDTINGCVKKKGTLRIVSDPGSCKAKKESPISFNTQGPAGPAGPEGPQGPDGGDAGTLDGKDSAEFLGADAKAADSDKLDGKDSSAFQQSGSPTPKALTLVGGWTTADFNPNTPAFYKDAEGIVHLEGAIKCPSGSCDVDFATLPAGSRPNHDLFFPIYAFEGKPGSLSIDSSGKAHVFDPANDANVQRYASLENVTFRAAQ